MTIITTRLTASPDGAISAATPLPPGEYEAAITVASPYALASPAPASPAATAPYPRRSVHDLIRRDTPWDDSISLRREDMYGDDGR